MLQHNAPGDSPGTTHRAGKARRQPRHAAPQQSSAKKRWRLVPALVAGPLLLGTVAMASPVAHSIHYRVASPVTVQALGLDNQNPTVGQPVRAGAKIVAEHTQWFDAVVFAVRDEQGHHADFPVTRKWRQGTHQRVYQASRAFDHAGTYTYWFAYQKNGHWTDLAPKQKFTVAQPGTAGGTPAPTPSGSPASPSGDPASPSPSPSPDPTSPSGSTSAPGSPAASATTAGSSTPSASGTTSSAPAPKPAGSTASSTTSAPSPAGPTASPSPSTSGATSGREQAAYVTFYAARDNDPPGSPAIAYPDLHQQAGGTGTFADPITFATDKSEIAPGTKIYVPRLRKYFVMEDDCAECDSDWSNGKWRVDLYMGGSTQPGVVACENQMTQDGNVTIVINPDANRPVDAHALYSDSTGCYTTTY
ncbi:MAG TPA: hypothetical protein VF054_16915 [Micromonosporaceae bacterium]